MTISIQEKKLEGRVSLLTIENEILKERLAFIESIYKPRLALPADWCLTIKEDQLLSILYGGKGRYMAIETLLMLMTDHTSIEYQPSTKTIEVWVRRLRVKIGEQGLLIEIISRWGQGYALTLASCRFLSQFAIDAELDEYREFKSQQKRA